MTREVVEAKAASVFGERADHWLQNPNKALSGQKPAGLLDTPEGRERVYTVLVRIEHGIYT
jgi:uncharacterized protein (DUF2384 family)